MTKLRMRVGWSVRLLMPCLLLCACRTQLLDAGVTGNGGGGTGGHATVIDLGGTEKLYAVALQADGRIVGAGRTTATGAGDFLVARYLANGSRDPSFGIDGIVVTDIRVNGVSALNTANAVAIQPDGRIVAAGVVHGTRNPDIAVARYLPDGSLDRSFGGGGIVTLDVATALGTTNASDSDEAQAIAIQPDGRILIAGTSAVGHSQGPAGYWSEFVVLRLLADGRLDPTLGGRGGVLTDFGNSSFPFAVTLLPDGRIAAAGSAYASGSYNFATALYLTDGRLDASFGNQGVSTLHLGATDTAWAMAIGADGTWLLAGDVTSGGSGSFASARFHADGSVDNALGGRGFVTTAPAASGMASARGVSLVPGGGYVLGGFAPAAGGTSAIAMARYREDGTLDDCFGNAGIFVAPTATPPLEEVALAMAREPDGTAVLAGSLGSDALIVLYPPDEAPFATNRVGCPRP